MHLAWIAVIGLVAQLIDGALGMGYGSTTSSLMLAIGATPVLASTTTHLAEIGTTLVAGISHHHFRNVDWRAVAWLGIPGGAGALVGALALTRLDAEMARPWMSSFLLVLGAYCVTRFALVQKPLRPRRELTARFLAPLGLIAGALDGAGGGGWGPLGTSTLLASRRIEPRVAVGTIDTGEFLVATCASVGFLLGLRGRDLPWAYVGALLAGGVVAAPFAAWLVRKLHPRSLGIAIGTLLLFTNLRTLLGAVDLPATLERVVVLSLVLPWLALIALALTRVRRHRRPRPA